MKTPSRAEGDKASENNGKFVDDSETSNSDAVTAGNGVIEKGIGVGQSPFEVEGEA